MYGVMFKPRTKVKDDSTKEGILRDVIQELDRERTKRAELENRLNEIESKMNLSIVDTITTGNSNSSDISSKEESLSINLKEINEKISNTQQNSTKDDNTMISKSKEGTKGIVQSLIGQVEKFKRKDFQKRMEQYQTPKQTSVPELVFAKQRIKSLETERDGLIEIIDSLVNDCEAIRVAKKTISTATNHHHHQQQQDMNYYFPLEMIRLLEFTPWNVQAQQYYNITKEVYEWQVYVSPYGWSSKIIYFPVTFIMPSLLQNTKKIWPSNSKSESSSYCYCDPYEDSFFNHILSPNAILTDKEGTNLIDINIDITPPNYGTWEWIGGWKIDLENEIPSDTNGWSYSIDKISMLANMCYDSPTATTTLDENGNIITTSTIKNKMRRRRWVKQCVLLSYPSISDKAKNFLVMNAQNAGLSLSVGKFTRQLLDMQGRLNESEQKLAIYKEINLNDTIMQEQLLNNQDTMVLSSTNNSPLTAADSNKSSTERVQQEDKQYIRCLL